LGKRKYWRKDFLTDVGVEKLH